MHGLTLHRPWDEPLGDGMKPVENRSWIPGRYLVGKPIAIHAGKKWDPAAVEAFEEILGLEDVLELGYSQQDGERPERVGAIVAVATLAGWIAPDREDCYGLSERDIGFYRASPWYTGDIGLVFKDHRPLESPIPCRGMQGFWHVPVGAMNQLRNQLGMWIE